MRSKSQAERLLVAVAVLLFDLMLTACSGPTNTVGSANQLPQPQNADVVLPVPTVAQETPDWCWLASGQMVFEYFGIPAVNPNYQCGIIGAFAGPSSVCFYNCSLCPIRAGSTQNVGLMLQAYAQIATNNSRTLTFQFIPAPLSQLQVQQEIDAKRPIVAGINPSGTVVFGTSQHLVVVVGYQMQAGQFNVVVNDPFPFEAAGYPDPYLLSGGQQLQPGQYTIGYDSFVNLILWNTSWYDLTLI